MRYRRIDVGIEPVLAGLKLFPCVEGFALGKADADDGFDAFKVMGLAPYGNPKKAIDEIKQIIHPRAIIPIRIGDHVIEPSIQRTVLSFFILYIVLFGFGVILISLFGYDLISSIGASISALGNVGPAWGEFGPTDNFAPLPYAAKWVLIIFMMIGRLELFTVIILFSPSFWKQ